MENGGSQVDGWLRILDLELEWCAFGSDTASSLCNRVTKRVPGVTNAKIKLEKFAGVLRKRAFFGAFGKGVFAVSF